MKTEQEVLTSYEEQVERWVVGRSHHALVHKSVGEECCPDFSCCNPGLLQPVEVRKAFQAADRRGRERFLMAFLGGLLSKEAPDVRAYITDGSGEVGS
jgi:hypothetical protein